MSFPEREFPRSNQSYDLGIGFVDHQSYSITRGFGFLGVIGDIGGFVGKLSFNPTQMKISISKGVFGPAIWEVNPSSYCYKQGLRVKDN